jgi:ketosteroid isomerase-like protein
LDSKWQIANSKLEPRTTVSGERYANTYCLVIRMGDGQLREMTEYMDPALVERVLQPPAWRSAGKPGS